MLKKTRLQGLDKFYTLPNISKQCIETTKNIVDFTNFDLIVEPSSGNGSFFNQINFTNKIGLDICPEDPNILQQDFLKWKPSNEYNKILVIGNPPFGKLCSTAIKFFNHSAEWADVIAFIIPRTFKKNSIVKRLNPYFHLVYSEDLPTNPCCFIPKMSVKCCFQIWQKKKEIRKDEELTTFHDDWTFLKFGPKDSKNQPTPPNNADFAIRAYGGKIGEIKKIDLEKLRPKSWHWIKSNEKNITTEDLIKRFSSLNFSGSCNTARQNSMGKAELIKLYNQSYFIV